MHQSTHTHTRKQKYHASRFVSIPQRSPHCPSDLHAVCWSSQLLSTSSGEVEDSLLFVSYASSCLTYSKLQREHTPKMRRTSSKVGRCVVSGTRLTRGSFS